MRTGAYSMAQQGSSSSRTPRSSSSGSRRGRTTAPGQSLATTNCTHYARNCNIVAPCCGLIVCCHQGHDSTSRCGTSLDLTRDRVTTLVCCSCKQAQPLANSCRFCSRSFGEHGCVACRLWYAGDGFHCNQCGICRQGRQDANRHCGVCNTCYPLHRNGRSAHAHVCQPNTTARACAGCGGDMRLSRRPCATMGCGHAMHCDCFLERVRHNFSCPRRDCRKTVSNMKDWYDALESVVTSQLATYPTSEVNISCLNCRATSRVRSAGSYRRCSNCNSMNTVRVPASMPFALPPLQQSKR